MSESSDNIVKMVCIIFGFIVGAIIGSPDPTRLRYERGGHRATVLPAGSIESLSK